MYQSYGLFRILLKFIIYCFFLELKLCTMSIFLFKKPQIWIFNADKSIQMYANHFSCIIMFEYSWIVQKTLLVDKC